MIYMVEMDFRNAEREHDWHTWYIGHVTTLITKVPGFRATQRFRGLTPMPAPWMAIHDVVSPDIFESKEYKAVGGPASTGEWQNQHTNWTRNAYAGIDNTPNVPLDAHLHRRRGRRENPGTPRGEHDLARERRPRSHDRWPRHRHRPAGQADGEPVPHTERCGSTSPSRRASASSSFP